MAPDVSDIVSKPGSDRLWRVDGFRDHCSFAEHRLVVMAILSPLVGHNWGPSYCPVEDLRVVRKNSPQGG